MSGSSPYDMLLRNGVPWGPCVMAVAPLKERRSTIGHSAQPGNDKAVVAVIA